MDRKTWLEDKDLRERAQQIELRLRDDHLEDNPKLDKVARTWLATHALKTAEQDSERLESVVRGEGARPVVVYSVLAAREMDPDRLEESLREMLLGAGIALSVERRPADSHFPGWIFALKTI